MGSGDQGMQDTGYIRGSSPPPPPFDASSREVSESPGDFGQDVLFSGPQFPHLFYRNMFTMHAGLLRNP